MQYVFVALIVLALGLPALQLPTTLGALAADCVAREPRALWAAGGLVAGLLASLWLRRSARMRFLTTLLHELSHLAVGLLLGTSPRSLSAGEQAGLFQYELRGPVPKLRAFFITVAPYWFSPLLGRATRACALRASGFGLAPGCPLVASRDLPHPAPGRDPHPPDRSAPIRCGAADRRRRLALGWARCLEPDLGALGLVDVDGGSVWEELELAGERPGWWIIARVSRGYTPPGSDARRPPWRRRVSNKT